MEIYDIAVEAVLYILSMYVDLRFVNLMLKHRAEPPVRTSIVYMTAGIFNWFVASYCTISSVVTISAVAALLFMIAVVYEGNAFSRMAAALIVVTISVGAENIVWGVFLRADMEPGLVGNLISSLGRLTIIVILERYLKPGRQVRLPVSSFLNMMLISIGGIILSNILVQADLKSEFTLTGLCVVAIINMSTYHLYVKINEAYGREIERITMQQQIIMYQNQFSLIEKSEEIIRLIRHDIKKHMLLLAQYMQKDNFEEARAYVDQLVQSADLTGEYVKTGNKGIDCIVNHMLARADQLHCKKTVVIQVPETCFMPDFDLNMLLGNLLENALEALEKAEQRKLDLYIAYKKGVLYISLYNTYNGVIRKKGGQLATTKNPHGGHGLGMKCVQYIVEKYHGEMKIQTTIDLFKADIMIYVNAV